MSSSLFRQLSKVDPTADIYVYNNKIILTSQRGYILIHDAYNLQEGLYDISARNQLISGIASSPYMLESSDIALVEDIISYNNRTIDTKILTSPLLLTRSQPGDRSDSFIVYDGAITVSTDRFIATFPLNCAQTININSLNGAYEASNVRKLWDYSITPTELNTLENSLVVHALDSNNCNWDIELRKKQIAPYTMESYIKWVDNIWAVYDCEMMCTIYGVNEILNAFTHNKLMEYDEWLDERPEYVTIVKIERSLVLYVGSVSRTSEVLLEHYLDADVSDNWYDIKIPLYLFAELIRDSSGATIIEIPNHQIRPMLVKDNFYAKAGMFQRKW